MTPVCSENEFTCNDGACIPKVKRELYLLSWNTYSRSNYKMSAIDKVGYSSNFHLSLKTQVCNFKYECGEGEDEDGCPIATYFGECAGNLTKCNWKNEQPDDFLNWNAYKGNECHDSK